VKKLAQMKDIEPIFKDGITIMIGGFMTCGTPEGLVDFLVGLQTKDLTIIGNDSGFASKGIGKLIENKQVKKIIASHIGLNPETGRQIQEGILEEELVPQGTLIERIRSAGAGLGGFLTPTGVGTMVEKNKQKMNIDGREYLLELPLRADVALIRGSIADESGNTMYQGTSANFNPLMALAADIVILEAMAIVEVGQLKPEEVMTPGVLVDYLIQGGEHV
jgi:acetate CoA/acetoacetate CoA-transferase alpha subunit